MAEEYVLIKAGNDGVTIKVEIDEDGSVSISTLSSVFGEKVSGLTYINEATGNQRAVKCLGNKLFPPKSGWGQVIYTKLTAGKYNDDQININSKEINNYNNTSIISML